MKYFKKHKGLFISVVATIVAIVGIKMLSGRNLPVVGGAITKVASFL